MTSGGPARASDALWDDADRRPAHVDGPQLPDHVCFAAERGARLLRPVKMHHELHGNSLPHLHVRLFPRFRRDRLGGGPIDIRLDPVRQSPDDLARLAAAFGA